jgi:Putative prokaryotic signal transducing protein
MSSESQTAEFELVTVRTFTNEAEANIAKGALEAFGIDCIITRDDCGGLRPHMALTGGLRLLVRADDAARAAEVLTSRVEASE